jgi:putative membrane protein
MMPSDLPGLPAVNDSIFQGRLHPMTLLFALLKSARGFILPIIPLLIFGNRLFFVSVLGFFFLSSLIQALVRYFTFSYRIEGGELITRQGILEQKERQIPLERVQEIRIDQGVLHRLFGVVDANIETAGGQGPEASLSVLSRTEAERLRQAVFDRIAGLKIQDRQVTAAPSSADRSLIRHLEIRDLVLAGITSNHLVSAFVFLGTFMALLDNIIPEKYYKLIFGSINEALKQLFRQDPIYALIISVAGILLFFLITILFSVIGSIILFYGFTLSRSGEDLYRSYGLLTRRASNLPRHRIQVVEIEEGLLRRLFHLATLRADTVGSVKEAEEKKKGRDVLIPIVARDEIDSLLPLLFPDMETEPAQWKSVSRLAIKRGMVKGGIFCTFAAVGLLVYYRDPIGLWPLALMPFVYWLSLLRYKNFGYIVGERFFRTRRGVFGRSTHIVPIRKAQSVEVRQTPFDRRLGLATLIVDTAGQAYTGGKPTINNLPKEEAYRIARILSQKAVVMRY